MTTALKQMYPPRFATIQDAMDFMDSLKHGDVPVVSKQVPEFIMVDGKPEHNPAYTAARYELRCVTVEK